MTKYDKILIGIIFLASIAALYLIQNQTLNSEGQYIVITVDNEIFRTYSIDKKLNEEIEIKTKHGINIVHIEDGFVYMESSTCRDQICVLHGKICRPGEMIVCLPNKIVIEVTGIDSDLDVISH
ncbi:MAG: NusG domain II-containing protein [Tissierellales bacterium]|nr:NusG domain II-containing protein [Tissierellales bacterium]MBN2827848.1 NusG domain II-containing protein [Tissierellales bacterium]